MSVAANLGTEGSRVHSQVVYEPRMFLWARAVALDLTHLEGHEVNARLANNCYACADCTSGSWYWNGSPQFQDRITLAFGSQYSAMRRKPGKMDLECSRAQSSR